MTTYNEPLPHNTDCPSRPAHAATPIEQSIARVRRRQMAIQQMTADLRQIIARPAAAQTWQGTQRDLMEMVHLVWQEGVLVDARGLPYTQKQLVRLAFAAVGRPAPTQPSRVLYGIHNRLHEERSMLRRYENLVKE